MNVFELFCKVLPNVQSQSALVSGIGQERSAISYAKLERRVDNVAVQFAQHGLKPGDRVLLAVPVSVDSYVVMLALLKAGMIVMLIDPAHDTKKVASILRSWPPAAIVATRPILLLRFFAPELRAIRCRFVVGGRSAGAIELDTDRHAATAFRTVRRSSADSALLSFTSGSTGLPKPVIRTHGFLRQQIAILHQVADTDSADVDLVAMPMFVLFNLVNGVTSVIPACDMKNPGTASPRAIFAQLRDEKANRMVASPALVQRLADYCRSRALVLPHLQRVSTGGGPVSPNLASALKLIAPNASLRMVYGSTEAEPIACIDDFVISVTAKRKMRAGSGLLVGKPVPGCSVRVVRSQTGVVLGPFSAEEFADHVLRAGDIGEIVVSGKHVQTSYADTTSNAGCKISVEGRIWHRTGDAGYFDSSGNLWLVGRCSAAISDSRGVIYPFQIEYALSGLSGVRRVALLAREGRRLLVVEPAGKCSPVDCVSAAACVAGYQIDQIVAVRRIPMDKRHNAKIDYPALEKLLDGRWPRIRLMLIESLSSVFRSCRSSYRRMLNFCKSRRTASAAASWRQRPE